MSLNEFTERMLRYHEFYYENGKLQNKGTYVDGELHGLHLSYYDNGELQSESSYYLGKESGERREYHRDGKLGMKGSYQGHLKHGLWKYYDEDKGYNFAIREYDEKGQLVTTDFLNEKGQVTSSVK